MTKNQLIKKLEELEGDPAIIVRDGIGWANIERVETDGCSGVIIQDEGGSPFSDE